MDPVEPALRSLDKLDDFALPSLAESQFAGIRKFRQAHPAACLVVEVTALQQAVCDYILGSTQFMLALYDAPDRVTALLRRVASWSSTRRRGREQNSRWTYHTLPLTDFFQSSP